MSDPEPQLRGELQRQLGGEIPSWRVRWLVVWLRYAVPLGILAIGAWWFASEVLGIVGED